MKILAKSSLHKRAIRVGLLSHGIPVVGSNNHIAATNPGDMQSYLSSHPSARRSQKILVCLDALPVVGLLEKFKTQDVLNQFDEIVFVGDAGSTAVKATKYFGIPCKALYNQHLMSNLVAKIRAFGILDRATIGYYPSPVYGLKDLTANSFGTCFPKVHNSPRLIYAGQDGSHTIDALFRDSGDFLCNSVKEYVARLASYRYSTITEVCDRFHVVYAKLREFAREIPGAFDVDWIGEHVDLILFKSVQRFLLLSFLASEGHLIFMAYPLSYVNVYMRRYFSRFLHLDLGGAGGLELYYPRVVDGLISGHTFVTLNPVLASESFYRYDSSPNIVDHSLIDLHERVLLLHSNSGLIE